MVKGVHKKVIEVHQPDSAYFEKAIFYLRPGITQLPPELAQAAAREYLQELEPNPLEADIAVVLQCSALGSGSMCGLFCSPVKFQNQRLQKIFHFRKNFMKTRKKTLYFFWKHAIIKVMVFCHDFYSFLKLTSRKKEDVRLAFTPEED